MTILQTPNRDGTAIAPPTPEYFCLPEVRRRQEPFAQLEGARQCSFLSEPVLAPS
jgi:hypothetical protein